MWSKTAKLTGISAIDFGDRLYKLKQPVIKIVVVVVTQYSNTPSSYSPY